MSATLLQKYLPENTLPFLKKWVAHFSIHIKITKDRNSKLGDYRKLPDKSHQITINSTLEPQLFFFVLTHELAHLLAFEKFGFRIAPHGNEWKHTFRNMLIESISAYKTDLQPIIINFSKSPKANFMASPDLVAYFEIHKIEGNLTWVQNLSPNEKFVYKNQQYILIRKIKKNYLCRNLSSGLEYRFSPLAQVEPIIE